MSKTGPDGNPSEQMTSAMSKLKDSVNKLRDHLDSLQRRRSLPPMSSSEADQLLSGLRKKSAAHKNKEKASQNKQDAEAKLAVKDSVSKADSAPAKADSTPAVTTSTTTTSTKSSSEKPAKLTNGHGPASDISAQKPEINHKSNHKASRRTVPAAIMAEPEKPLEQSQVQLRQKRRSYIRHDSINKEGWVHSLADERREPRKHDTSTQCLTTLAQLLVLAGYWLVTCLEMKKINIQLFYILFTSNSFLKHYTYFWGARNMDK